MGFLFKKKDTTSLDSLNGFDLQKGVIKLDQYDENPAMNEAVQIMANDGVNICARACSICWDTKIPTDYNERAEYISRRTKIGHASVIEHSNHVYYIEVPDDEMKDLAEFLSVAFYVHTVYKHSKKYNKGYLIIGGSWRAYRDLIVKLPDINANRIMIKLLSIMQASINSCAYTDLINAGILDKSWFDDGNYKYNEMYSKLYNKDINSNLYCENIDDMNVLLENIRGMCPEPELFTMYDLLDMCTVTILFKNMSRIITQQLTRHRNSITQESQRYVNYANVPFNSPAKFKVRYDPTYQYPIQFGKSSQKMTLQEIGDAEAKLYGQLTDKVRTAGHDLLKEDARAYLPSNIQCQKLYMTFTWRNFFIFLELREAKNAQAEIREYATALGDWFRDLYPAFADFYKANSGYGSENTNSVYYYPLTPLENVALNGVDEIISEEEIIEEMEKYAEKHPSGDEEEV